MDLTNNVKLTRVTDALDSCLNKIQRTYISSFPVSERRDFLLFCFLLKDEPLFNLFAIHKNDEYAGFITCWNFEEFVYVEHFAIDESVRSGGIGSVSMKEFLHLIEKIVILEVEDIVDDLTQRRVRFYEALGFKLHTPNYKQPPYRNGDLWYDMKLMSYGESEMDERFETIKDRIYAHVYNIKKPD